MELKLFVWEDTLCDYTSGIMFALAENVEEAKKLIIEKIGFEPSNGDLNLEPVVYDNKVGFAVWGGG